jgi:hypothetical protein
MVKPTAGSWDVVPYRGAQTNDVEALRAEIADLTATLERLRGMSIYPFGNDCVVCGEPREPRRRWVPARRGFFGLFARPAHFQRWCNVCKATWREAPRVKPELRFPL